ncbi:WbqC family protein [Flavobacteriaceae bacterium S356]|uniref:WbqC family protein n=1 Tax=Asprobacillus argus TaxID=3076534 RepID=A0ABU3LI00_9FLAO|nr:WbqC family protein [Flavobacteriaceae bacterium S356]
MSLFIPTYFSPVSQYSEIIKSNTITFEVEDNFQKQTYRNRCYIYGANGKQLLNVPVSHPPSHQRKKTKDTLVSNESDWQRHHFKSIQIAYRSSPFFEFYEDDLARIFTKKYNYLLDLSIDTFLFFNDALELEKKYERTVEYLVESPLQDFRRLACVKQEKMHSFKPYIQVFDEKHGFIENLSMLDLLFMEGPNSFSYL